ncbi:hypothetical protein [Amycolatopsis sp. EV170708-02-1]|uniref:hypothetical protein n=1 Tax=Amycolatopsis sp. EV170708-02-1 TaxID=2919322 RepID=UPI001F0BE434|nr:hypothetical protein [Amycolatopsis sp. EV170708-02-1]UMP07236.1 hypothetical protein MJQ72_21565 [Amycolatopsis sp. EV170708-02-1]
MSGDSGSTQLVIAFDSTVPAAERQDLVLALAGHDVSARRGLDLGFRSPGPDQVVVVTVAVLTMLSTGFVQRFGEQAADQVGRVFTTARDWLRRRRSVAAAPAQVEIVDQALGIEFRVSADDPDAAGRLLSEAVRAASQLQQNRPLRWIDDRWAPDNAHTSQAETRPRPTVEK